MWRSLTLSPAMQCVGRSAGSHCQPGVQKCGGLRRFPQLHSHQQQPSKCFKFWNEGKHWKRYGVGKSKIENGSRRKHVMIVRIKKKNCISAQMGFKPMVIGLALWSKCSDQFVFGWEILNEAHGGIRGDFGGEGLSQLRSLQGNCFY